MGGKYGGGNCGNAWFVFRVFVCTTIVSRNDLSIDHKPQGKMSPVRPCPTLRQELPNDPSLLSSLPIIVTRSINRPRFFPESYLLGPGQGMERDLLPTCHVSFSLCTISSTTVFEHPPVSPQRDPSFILTKSDVRPLKEVKMGVNMKTEG